MLNNIPLILKIILICILIMLQVASDDSDDSGDSDTETKPSKTKKQKRQGQLITNKMVKDWSKSIQVYWHFYHVKELMFHL